LEGIGLTSFSNGSQLNNDVDAAVHRVVSHGTTLMAGASSDHGNALQWLGAADQHPGMLCDMAAMVRSGMDSSGALIRSSYMGAE